MHLPCYLLDVSTRLGVEGYKWRESVVFCLFVRSFVRLFVLTGLATLLSAIVSGSAVFLERNEGVNELGRLRFRDQEHLLQRKNSVKQQC